ncbi:Ig-like domain-containing protein [Salimicrobium halophilum]|uniref:SbsA Ig-like domain-containing protein n=1 Tax=Salimicrobium halophilum TaxID=86666 RepID=A0A1G8S5H0_9BACI|nr:Ig-like domain-containing protein [Salimicrobium halophilum]SDJ24504.1 hypothetical protein SAMN04490247_1264 [Salimicrobium halophilum]
MRTLVLAVLLVIAIPFVASAEEIQWEEKNGVDADKNWTVEFNVPLEDTTENKNFIFVQTESGEVLENGVSLDGKKATIYANNLYEAGQSYELHITEELAFENGKMYQNNLIMPFTIQTDDSSGNEGSYFDAELEEGLAKGKLKGAPLSLGNSINAPDEQIGTNYENQELLGFQFKYYTDYAFGWDPNAEEEGLKAIIKQLPADTYDRSDVEEMFGNEMITQYREEENQTAAVYLVGEYQLVVTYEGNGIDGSVTAVGLVDYL